MKLPRLLFALSLGVLALASRTEAQVFVAPLLGTNEVPATSSTATGWVTVTYDSIAHTLRINTSFSGLSGATTAAHIHAPALPGVNTGIATPSVLPGFPIGVNSGVFDGTLNLTLAQSFAPGFLNNNGGTATSAEAVLASALNSGQAYFNIHTNVHGGGEVRGNLVAVPDGSSVLGLLVPTLVGLVGLVRWNRRRSAV